MKFIKYCLFVFVFLFVGDMLFAKGVLSISKNEVINDNANFEDFNSFLNLQFTKNKSSSTNYNYSYDINVRKYNNDDTPLFSIPAMYIEKVVLDDTRISVGRKHLDWNEAVSFWSLGEVMSTQGFDLLNDRDEGLTGVHMSYQGSSLSVDFFASGFFIPSLNPALDIGDGQISARSEWSALPPQFVSLEGQLVPIEYDVNIPSLNKLLMKESVALRLSTQTRAGEFSIYGGRKPENSFRINATGFLDQSGDDKVVVNARPFTNMHNFFGSTWTKRWSKKLKTSLSYEAINPDRGVGERYEIGGFAIEPVYNNISYSSFLASYRDDLWGVDFSVLQSFSTYEDTNEAFARRMRFESAVAIAPYIRVSDAFFINAKYQFDNENKDHLLVANSTFQISRKTSFSLRYQMIESPGDSSFWSRYRENDLWQANLAFNF